MNTEIRISGARENNLKDISLNIPKHKITVFTGVSGAGKSSLVFDTIAAEAQRQLSAAFTNYLPHAGRPDADSLENLTASVIIDQKPIRGNKRSTVGTVTEIYSLLRLLFSRIGQPQIGFSNAFSFNKPEGMCPECQGLGEKIILDTNKLIRRNRSLYQDAINFYYLSQQWKRYADLGLFNGEKTLNNYSESEWSLLLHGSPNEISPLMVDDPYLGNYHGLVDTFNRRYINRDISALSEETRRAIEAVTIQGICPSCQGTRLNQRALNVRIKEENIAQLAGFEAVYLKKFMDQIDHPAGQPIIQSISNSLGHLITLGLGYLSLNRPTSTLSAGEAQRIKMVRHLGSSLSDLTYIFDEPTIGLHPRDVQGLIKMLQTFRNLGNTILVIEHDPDVIAVADHVVDLGPGAGRAGGNVVYQGSVNGLLSSETLTGKFLGQSLPIKKSPRQSSGIITIKNAKNHNLNNISVDIPEGVLTVLTGVAGAGKSSLMEDFLVQHPEAVLFDQSPIHTSSRSITTTYIGILDEIRKIFSESNGVSPSLFSFNSEGACPMCNGLGFVVISLPFMDPVKSTCELCQGKRYKKEVLAFTWQGKSISDILDMTVDEAIFFFKDQKISSTLNALADVGLGYITLGQPLNTYSGGECQRLKLSEVLQITSNIYILDEPTVSLHFADLAKILAIINRLIDQGNTVIIVEHNLEVIKRADWVIDLGPGGGNEGGNIVFEGTLQELLENQNFYTAKYLRKNLEKSNYL